MTIFEDNLEQFQEKLQQNDLRYRYGSWSSTPHIDLAAACGSINIFNFLLLNNSQITNKTAKRAIEGGNIDIIKILQNKNISFDHCLRKSIKAHRNTISDWLLSNFSCEKIDLIYCLVKGNTQAANFLIQNQIIILENPKYAIDLTSLGVIRGNLDLVNYFYSLQHETVSSDIEVIVDQKEVEEMESELKKREEERKLLEEEVKRQQEINRLKQIHAQNEQRLKLLQNMKQGKQILNPNEPIYVGSSTSEEEKEEEQEKEEEEEDLSEMYFRWKHDRYYRYYHEEEEEEEEEEEREEDKHIVHPPITYSVVNNFFEITKFLVEKGEDVNYKPKFHSECDFTDYIKGSNSLLSIAIKKKNTEIAKLLIENGADVNYECEKDGITWPMLAYSIKKHLFEISKLLIEKGALPYRSVKRQHRFYSVDRLWTPLILAVKEDSLELVKIIVERGAYIDFYVEEHFGVNTAMTMAVQCRRFEMLDYLISRGGNVNEFHTITPLFVAVKNNDAEMIKFLAARKVDLNKELYIERRHLTPLAYAAYLGKTDAARALIEVGADTKLRNPLGQAQRQKHMDIVGLLSKGV
ncbi:hypothetical protein TVAG_364110 [Trichomonas vaginalis G3]|uniref:DUF3447 domain-containing protein n=1 Tax=Trichomonas vaginalis (strain ATCC PRA-98 / G3) TaxID=412133 RepID=A2E9C4_TRIV3|nr:protein ubiquitination [Trichomonas vaginalis G3]EAY10688.1 hypothetical protein TVAG_364110 [Trichomonas vaginalis G3]KAI5538581.1 protein ubiquitination [Trichomonas vaginalis G3]|eukprot:XP_001322911.1 hypothetical protein [Trichomonas vaginalis G3]